MPPSGACPRGAITSGCITTAQQQSHYPILCFVLLPDPLRVKSVGHTHRLDGSIALERIPDVDMRDAHYPAASGVGASVLLRGECEAVTRRRPRDTRHRPGACFGFL